MGFCANCGSEAQVGERFCGDCGNALEQTTLGPAGPIHAPQSGNDQLTAPLRKLHAEETGLHISTVAGVVSLVAFLLPWVSCQGVNATGLELATKGNLHATWIVPLAGAFVLGVLYRVRTRAGKVARAEAMATAVSGTASCLVLLFYYLRLKAGVDERNVFGMFAQNLIRIEFGATLAFLSSAVIALGGFLSYNVVARERPICEVNETIQQKALVYMGLGGVGVLAGLLIQEGIPLVAGIAGFTYGIVVLGRSWRT